MGNLRNKESVRAAAEVLELKYGSDVLQQELCWKKELCIELYDIYPANCRAVGYTLANVVMSERNYQTPFSPTQNGSLSFNWVEMETGPRKALRLPQGCMREVGKI